MKSSRHDGYTDDKYDNGKYTVLKRPAQMFYVESHESLKIC